MHFDPARAVVSGQTCSKYSSNQRLYRATMPLKVVCHSLGNVISCLDDIIVMLRSDWPTSERTVSRAGWPVYKVGVGMH